MTARPLLLAHRGDHRNAPENSPAAFRAAVDAGCDGAELDVRRSRDGVAMVIHDATLDRVQGVPDTVARRTAAELAAYGVATLVGALEAVPASFVMDVELKETGVVDAAIEAIEAVRGPAAANVVLSSFSRAALARVAERRPAWPRWLVSDSARAVAAAAGLGCAAVAPRVDMVDARLVDAAHRLGLLVVTWTIRDAATRDRLAALRVDALCVEGAALPAADLVPLSGRRTRHVRDQGEVSAGGARPAAAASGVAPRPRPGAVVSRAGRASLSSS